jgi:hypothetical protein
VGWERFWERFWEKENCWERKDWLVVRNEFGGAEGNCGLAGTGCRGAIFLCTTTPRAAGKALSTSNGRLTTCDAPERKKTWACDLRKTTSARERTSVVGGTGLTGAFGSVAGCVPWVRKLLDWSLPLYSAAPPRASEAACECSSTKNHVKRACLTFSFSTSKLKILRMTPPRDQIT